MPKRPAAPRTFYHSMLLEVRPIDGRFHRHYWLPPGALGHIAIWPPTELTNDHKVAALGRKGYLVDIYFNPTHWPGSSDRLEQFAHATSVIAESRRGNGNPRQQLMDITFIGSYLLEALNKPEDIPRLKETRYFPYSL